MRTVTENLKNRLIIQSEEAEVQGLTKIASHLIDQAESLSIRSDDQSYTYSNDDFQNDIESSIWGAVVRFADFHNVTIDAIKAQDLVEKIASDLISELRVKTGTIHGVGAFEPTVSGEERKTVILDVNEDD